MELEIFLRELDHVQHEQFRRQMEEQRTQVRTTQLPNSRYRSRVHRTPSPRISRVQRKVDYRNKFLKVHCSLYNY